MKRLMLAAIAGLCLLLTAVNLHAQNAPIVPVSHPLFGGSSCPPPCIVLPDCKPAMPGQPGQPDQPPPSEPALGADAFARAPEAGTQPAASADPGIFGDLIGIVGGRVTILPHAVSGAAIPHGAKIISGNRIAIIAPLPERSAFKITENESPLPQDRVFFNYNYYNNVDRVLPGAPTSDLNRETIGFEKTFLDGNASVGLRVPFLQLSGGEGLDDSHIDDISLLFKYAFINNRATGNVLSGGLVLTAPTGQSIQIQGETPIHSTVFQPFVGWIYHISPDLFLQGFSSVAAPTDSRDVTLMFNSAAAGYHLWRSDEPDSRLRGIIPVLELHINTPLDHRGLDNSPLGFDDSVDLTGGCYFQFRRATLGIGVCTPLTGPKPYDVEAMASFNFHF